MRAPFFPEKRGLVGKKAFALSFRIQPFPRRKKPWAASTCCFPCGSGSYEASPQCEQENQGASGRLTTKAYRRLASSAGAGGREHLGDEIEGNGQKQRTELQEE